MKIILKDDLFDSWIDLVLNLVSIKSEFFNFDRSLKLAMKRDKSATAPPFAYSNFGTVYEYGYGADQDFSQAMEYFKKSC